MNMTVLTPPSEEPLALGAAKDYLRIGHDGEDALVRSLIEGARARLEIELGIALVTRTLQITLDAWPASLSRNGIRLAPAPVKALVRVEHVHVSGEREDITARFLLRGDNLCLRPWAFAYSVAPGGRIEITIEAGFGNADAVPDDLVLAVKMLTAQGYNLRDGGPDGGEDALPVEIDELLAPYKGVRL